jgi:hypothetical protein
MGAGFGSPFPEREAAKAGGSGGDDSLRSALTRLSLSLDRIHALLGELHATARPGAWYVATRPRETQAAAVVHERHPAGHECGAPVSRTDLTRASMPSLTGDPAQGAEEPCTQVVYGGGPSAFRSR